MIDSNDMAQEYVKAYTDKSRIYFIEKYLSTFDGTEGKNVPFVLFPRQKVYCEALGSDNKVISIKHRQCGISTTSCAWISGQLVFAKPDSPETVLCIANKLEQACELLVKIRDFLEQVPRWYWGDDYYSPDPNSENNKKNIFVKNSKAYVELCNGCKIYAKAAGPNSARGVSSVSILILDEAAFMEEGPAAYASAVAATSAVANAKIIMVSTPNGKDQLYYQTYKQAIEKKNGFTVVEFKWYQDLRYNRFLKWHRKNENTGEEEWITERTIDDKGRIEYTPDKWRELEREGWKATSPWYIKMCKSFNNDSMKIAQELDVSFLGSSDNVVPADVIEKIRIQDVCDPLPDYGDPMEELSWFWKRPVDGHRYILACLPEGEKVITRRGEVKVEDVTYEDELLTKDGKWTKIKKRFVRDVKDEEIITISLSHSQNKVAFTHNHPIYASINSKYKIKYVGRDENHQRIRRGIWEHDFEFHNANELKKGDWVICPKRYQTTISENELNSYWEEFDEFVPNKVYKNKKIYISSPLNEEDFWWYCGMWLAEGSASPNGLSHRISTTHSELEVSYVEKIKNIIFKYLHRSATFTYRKKSHAIDVTYSSAQMMNFLIKTFGKGAHNKHISEWVKKIPNIYKLALLKGYFEGDGSGYYNKISAISASKQLILDIQDILYSLDIVSCISNKPAIDKVICGRTTHSNKAYVIGISGSMAYKLSVNAKLYEGIIQQPSKSIKCGVYLENDKYLSQITNVDKKLYTGKVYNFEVEDETHTFCCRGITTHNCDPSLGSSADRTSIQVIDADGTDDYGMPYYEQIMEYNGRILGDKLGDLLYKYATLFNNAYVIVDATGGSGDACLLRLMNYWGYKNLYYDDKVVKEYMKITQKSNERYAERMPGFHFQGNRFSLLRNFANMVTDGAFIIHSVRLCNELDTWIFKGEDGRMDHMTGNNDDNITCTAMALFILKFSFQKLEASKSRDAAILNGYMMSGGYRPVQNHLQEDTTVAPKSNMALPFYSSRKVGKSAKYKTDGNPYMWLMAGYY